MASAADGYGKWPKQQGAISAVLSASMERGANKAMKSKLIKFFIYSSAFLLVLTAVAKFLSATGNAPLLVRADPFFHISYRLLFLLVGTIEMAVAAICLCTDRIWLQAGLLAWLVTNFMGYRISLKWAHIQYCGCLGTLGQALPISPAVTDRILKFVLLYLALGSYALVFWLCIAKRRSHLAVDVPTSVANSSVPSGS
jgi:hypothetical protein